MSNGKRTAAALVALSLGGPASASQWWMLNREEHEPGALTVCVGRGRGDPNFDLGSPASYFRFLKSQERNPTLREDGDEVIIVYSEYGHVWRLRFFRTLEACQRVAAANRAAAEAEAERVNRSR